MNRRPLLFLMASVSLTLAQYSMASPPKSGALSSSHDDASLRWGACPEFMPEGCAIAVLHGDPAKANADVFFKIPAGASVPRHWHSSPERMVLVSGRLQVKYDGQDAVSLQPGTYAYGPAKHPHEATCTSSSACVLVIAFELPVDAFPGGPADAGNR